MIESFMSSYRLCLLAALALGQLRAVEIATGSMLGPRYDQRAFYFRTPDNPAWRKTYTGPGYRRDERGKLMNLRLAQAVFHDEWLTEKPFDPERNTT